jgi:hypothetical protein
MRLVFYQALCQLKQDSLKPQNRYYLGYYLLHYFVAAPAPNSFRLSATVFELSQEVLTLILYSVGQGESVPTVSLMSLVRGTH